ncbi:MAG: saccharopine dehydrogenase NADP-binding domain-containing protein [Bacillota bacterium]|nr:saccharopine dehydrogenase NADP-binding domain-containing protein [Bacillota bacterium]
MGKKVLVLGTGAQGTTVAKRLDLEPNVDEIICADYDEEAAIELAGVLSKARGTFCDASDEEQILKLIEGCDLVVNALPLAYGKNVIDAALAAKCNYQDFAAPEGFEDTWEKCMYRLLTEYNEKFKAIGKLAIMGTGSAPGTMCVVARDTMKDIDQCYTIYMNVYEGVEAKRFQPYWWSPVTALNDMDDLPVAWIDGKMVNTKPFSLPIERTYDYVGYPVRFVEHAHDEPFYVGMKADELFKGCKNAYFKYGGVGIDFAEPLARAGLLKRDPVEVEGQQVNSHEVILKALPHPPRFTHEIAEIIEEGLISDTGAFVVEALGEKDGKPVRVESHLFAPGFVESFDRFGVTGEQYLTGQGGFLFTKLFVNDELEQTGLISSAELTEEENDRYLEYAKELDICIERRIVFEDPYFENQPPVKEYSKWWDGPTVVPVEF